MTGEPDRSRGPATPAQPRLDPGERRRVSEKALHAGAHSGALRQLGEALEPGAAVAAVLVEHVWVRALDDAVSRTGGKPLASELADAAALGELTADMIQAAARGEQLLG